MSHFLRLTTRFRLRSTNNRLVKNSALEAQKYDFQVSTMRSRRLPHFQFSVLGGELLQPFDFSTFAKGAFGPIQGSGHHSLNEWSRFTRQRD